MLLLPLTPNIFFRFLFVAVLGAALLPGLQAAEEEGEDDKVSDGDMQIEGVFNSALPGTEKKHRLKLLFRPHFGDFHRKDYLRVPLALRYGLTDNWDVTGGMEGYFAHGFGDVNWMEEYGFSAFRFSTKYRIGHRLWSHWDMGVGVDYITPVGDPPADVSDGLKHLGYHVSFSRELESMEGWRIFWGVGVDDVSTTGRPVFLEKNDLGDDSVNFSGGFVWQRTGHSYTLEISYATTRLTGTLDRDLFTIRPALFGSCPKNILLRAREIGSSV